MVAPIVGKNSIGIRRQFIQAGSTLDVEIVMRKSVFNAAQPPHHFPAGSLGTLIGADLTNLDKVRGLGAPVASIGGAGTFDGIFLTGILAVLLASLYARPRAALAG
jgi:uncharacterized membrane protein